MTNTARRLLVSWCAVTGSTEAAARVFGVAPLLPRVMAPRFARLAGVEPAHLAIRLAGARSFRDRRWTAYWGRIADAHLARAEQLLGDLAAANGAPLPDIPGGLFADECLAESTVRSLLSPVASYLTDSTPGPAGVVERYARSRHPAGAVAEETLSAVRALGAIRQAVAYYTVAAWPMPTPHRLRAYKTAQRLFRILLYGLAPALGISVGIHEVPIGAEVVRYWTMFPVGRAPASVVLATNGLDGTAPELLLPLLAHRGRGLGFAIMEMPGTYAYRTPIPAGSEGIYTAVVDQLTARLPGTRIAVLGLSFGGHWAVRTAAADRRVGCVVAVAPPTHRAFGPGGALGVPAILLRTMAHATGARGPWALGRVLRSLSLRKLYRRLTVPLLVIDGTADTVVDVRDCRELAAGAALGRLLLYDGDDHCAIGHFTEWLDVAVSWISAELGGLTAADRRRSARTRSPRSAPGCGPGG